MAVHDDGRPLVKWLLQEKPLKQQLGSAARHRQWVLAMTVRSHASRGFPATPCGARVLAMRDLFTRRLD